jgi:hypothetical protein
MQPTSFSNPLRFDSFEDVFLNLLDVLRGLIVTLALVAIVIGAVLYVTSVGNDGQIKTAKAAITAAMIGLAIGIAAPSFLKEISNVLGWTSDSAEVAGSLSLLDILRNVLDFLLSVVGILSMIMLLIGSLMLVTTAGDDHRAGDAKKIILASLTGIIVAFAALIIVRQIAEFFVG